MHKSGRFSFLLVVAGLLWTIGALAAGSAAPRYILFLTSDGFSTDYVEWYQPPTIKQLISEGVRVTHATNVFPSVTSPNMASLVTGSYPRTTGIGCNAQYEKEVTGSFLISGITEQPRLLKHSIGRAGKPQR